jgi:predicted metal-binding protein
MALGGAALGAIVLGRAAGEACMTGVVPPRILDASGGRAGMSSAGRRLKEGHVAKIGIIICDRERTCIGGKCMKAVYERTGVFRKYPKDQPLEVVGYVACGGCPGERLERAPAEMKKYGAEEIVLASCFLAGYPPCPYIDNFVQYIQDYVGLPVVVGSHPMPTNYIVAHTKSGDWQKDNLQRYLQPLVDDKAASDRYDSTRPDFLKK